MKRIHRLGRGPALDALFARGRRIRTPLFDLVIREYHGGAPRFAFVVPRSVSKRAVVRNRLRRRAREHIRRRMTRISAGRDAALIMHPAAAAATKKDFYGALEKILERL